MTKSAHPIKNIRTFALPNEAQPYTFAMNFEYDSWNRIQTIVYPDGEKVHYDYNLGGMLQSVVGDKGAQHFVYVKDIVYNQFELKEFVCYGNGTETYYKYDILQRLLHLYSKNRAGEAMQSIRYKYDAVSNITGIDNGAGVLNNGLGGKYSNVYYYDNSYRLAYAKGQWNGSVPCNFDMKMGYTDNGRIKMKQQNAVTFLSGVLSQSSYENNYNYNSTQPNTLARVNDSNSGATQDFGWDANGNLVFHRAEKPKLVRRLCWDEENRLMGVADNSYTSFYQYDAAGERTYKLTGEQHKQIVNGQTYTYCYLDNPTLYASPYLVATPRGYTKHYYAESERIASKIGGGKLYDLHSIVHDEQVSKKISYNAKLLYHVMECTGSKAKIEDLNLLKILTHLHDSLAPEKHLFWYHPDHLGSSSWITYTNGKSIQHLHYLPFGESFVDQRISSFGSRYTFSGKEKDVETGYGYFGARYYSSDLSIWLSVDPMADKYPSMSSYVYCADNPVKLVDPNGREVIITGDQAEATFNSLQSGTNLKLSKDENGKISAVGDPLNDNDNQLLNAINSTDVTVNINASVYNDENEGGGAYMGTSYNTENKTATSTNNVNIALLTSNQQHGAEGAGIIHEITEGYQMGLIANSNQSNISPAEVIRTACQGGCSTIRTIYNETPINQHDYNLYLLGHSRATPAPNQMGKKESAHYKAPQMQYVSLIFQKYSIH